MARHHELHQPDDVSAGTAEPAGRPDDPPPQHILDGAHIADQQRVSAAGGDLAHLYPDRLRLGGIGVFADDWAWTDDGQGRARIPVGFVGLFIDTWNGWAVFSCTRQVAEAIVAEQDRMRVHERSRFTALGRDGEDLTKAVDEACPPMWFDGEDLIVDNSVASGEQAVERSSPNPDGRYVVMGWSWCWTAVAPSDCDRIVGELPDAGQHQQYIQLTHTRGMQVPHDRLSVTVLRQVATPSGAAFTANLRLDGAVVGTASNAGADGATVVQLHTSALDREGLRAFVAGCRRYGEPVTETDVIAALVTENHLTVSIAAAQAQGGVLVRLLDDDGDIVEVVAVFGIPRGRGFRAALREAVDAHPVRQDDGINWEVWTGRGWQHLTRVPAAGGQPS